MRVNDKILFDSEPPEEQIQSITQSYKSGDFNAVLVKVTYLLSRFPSSILLLNFFGICHIKLENLDVAIEAYKTVVTLNPNDLNGHFSMAKIYHEKGSLDEAIVAYNNVLRINPLDVETLNSLGMCLQDKGNFDCSLKMFQKAINIKPDYSDALHNIEIVKMQLIE